MTHKYCNSDQINRLVLSAYNSCYRPIFASQVYFVRGCLFSGMVPWILSRMVVDVGWQHFKSADS